MEGIHTISILFIDSLIAFVPLCLAARVLQPQLAAKESTIPKAFPPLLATSAFGCTLLLSNLAYLYSNTDISVLSYHLFTAAIIIHLCFVFRYCTSIIDYVYSFKGSLVLGLSSFILIIFSIYFPLKTIPVSKEVFLEFDKSSYAYLMLLVFYWIVVWGSISYLGYDYARQQERHTTEHSKGKTIFYLGLINVSGSFLTLGYLISNLFILYFLVDLSLLLYLYLLCLLVFGEYDKSLPSSPMRLFKSSLTFRNLVVVMGLLLAAAILLNYNTENINYLWISVLFLVGIISAFLLSTSVAKPIKSLYNYLGALRNKQQPVDSVPLPSRGILSRFTEFSQQTLSELARLQNTCIESERDLDLIFNNPLFGIILLNPPDNRIIKVNDRFLELTGYQPSEVEGFPVDYLFSKEGCKLLREAINNPTGAGMPFIADLKGRNQDFIRVQTALSSMQTRQKARLALIIRELKIDAGSADLSLSDLVETIPIAAVIVNQKLRVEVINQKAARLISLDTSNCKGNRIKTLLYKPGRDNPWDRLSGNAEGGFEESFYNAADQPILLKVSWKKIEIEKNECIIVTLKPLTERKALQDTLHLMQTKHAEIRKMLDKFNEVTVEAELYSQLLKTLNNLFPTRCMLAYDYNESLEAYQLIHFIGIEPETVEGYGYLEILSQDQQILLSGKANQLQDEFQSLGLRAFLKHLQKHFPAGESNALFLAPLATKKQLLSLLVAIYDANYKPDIEDIRNMRLIYQESSRTLSQLKLNKLLQQQSDSMRLLQKRYIDEHNALLHLVDLFPSGLVICGANLLIKSINNHARHYLGVQDRHIMHSNILDIPGAALFKSAILKVRDNPQQKEIVRFEFKDDPRDKPQYLKAQIVGLCGENKRFEGLLIALENISSHVKRQKAIEELPAMISHEFRTPLTNIFGYLDILKSSLYARLTDEDHNIFESIDRQMATLRRMVDDMLDLARMKSDGLKIVPELVDVNELITEAVNDLKAEADVSNITLRAMPTSERLQAMADPLRIRQVLYNLISNGIKYASENGSVSVMAKESGEHVKVSVTDNGIGIPAHFQDRIFEPFFRVSPLLKQASAIQGSGLGLAISKIIIEKHKGMIAVKSKPGKGSTFYFTLPLADKPIDTPSKCRIAMKKSLEIFPLSNLFTSEVSYKENIILDTREYVDEQTIANWISKNKADVIIMPLLQGFHLISNGSALKLIYPFYQNECITVSNTLQQTRIPLPAAPSFWRNKTIVVGSRYSSCNLNLNRYLKLLKLNLHNDLTVEYATEPQIFDMLDRKKVDLAILDCVWGRIALSEGIGKQITLEGLETQGYNHGLFITADYLRANNSITRLLVNEILKGYKKLHENDKQVIQDLSGIILVPAEILEQCLHYYKKTPWEDIINFDKKLLGETIHLAVKYGIIDKELDIKQILVEEPLKYIKVTQTFEHDEQGDSSMDEPVSDSAEMQTPITTKVVSKIHRKPNILIIEDNTELQNLLKFTLSAHFNILQVYSLSEAIAFQPSERIDLILLDINLSDSKGIELLKKIREHLPFRETTIWVMSGQLSNNIKNKVISQGASQFIIKPFKMDWLKKKLGEHFHSESVKEVRKAMLQRRIPYMASDEPILVASMNPKVHLVLQTLSDKVKARFVKAGEDLEEIIFGEDLKWALLDTSLIEPDSLNRLDERLATEPRHRLGLIIIHKHGEKLPPRYRYAFRRYTRLPSNQQLMQDILTLKLLRSNLKTILVTDDVPENREFFKEVLLRLPAETILNDKGDAVPELISTREPDVQLLDFVLQGTSGLEVMQELENKRLLIPTVLVSMLSEDEELNALLHNPLVRFLARDKLFNMERLIEQIVTVLKAPLNFSE